MEKHAAIVQTVSSKAKRFYELKQPFYNYHGSTNSTRRSRRHAGNTIDTSQLNHVLAVDVEARTALVEPNVPLDQLVRTTLRHGLVPPVVMELPGITVGGGFCGTSGESSSFRHGAFDTTMNWIELVLPDGTVTRASRTDKPDLFWGVASAFGTLGVVTLLEIRLKEAKKYVQLDYALSTSAKDTVRMMEEEGAKESNEYVDGIVFSNNSTVVCTGRLTDDLPPGEPARRFTRRKDPWFYLRAQQAEKILQRGGEKERKVTDYIPIEDYLFRYDRGGFWVARYAFSYFITPFNRITRYALDPFMRTREMFRALHKSGLTDYYLVQDVGVPFAAVEEFQTFLDDEFNVYPLWLCPLRVRRDGPDAAHGLHSEFGRPDCPDLMNFGVWGPLAAGNDRCAAVAENRKLERKVQELRGKKWLYGQAFYTEEEFWAHYDTESYGVLREKYHAAHLPSVYDKVKVDVDAEMAARNRNWKTRTKARVWNVWPLKGLYGVYKTAMGAEYLLQKRKSGEE